ncbi:ATPase domain-containing protein [Helicobacter pylori]|uniref:ATPase domain-containing protein n=1 Tax=Helicobacter pylori TaxID=210 RepID=UPI002712C2EF|nr:ATPase domain-containing protein [Helicobacter pylori]MDO7818476.1 DnaB-like helicase C-terminal domain-containing protein [Helicobacter pylori]MDO7824626.1 DnaB-like helicase C-terminal domain-containing protein [Helicobacter pylori]
MQNLIMNSFINYPNDLEDFLEEIHISSFTVFNQKIIQALLDMKNKNQVVQLETIRLKIGDEAFESKEFSAILQADSYPNYLDLKSDFKTYLSLKMQEHLANELIKSTRKSEIFDFDFLGKYVKLGFKRNGKYYWEWEEFFKSKPKIEKIHTGIDFLDNISDGGFEVGQLILLSGDPEAGKTLLSIQYITNAQQKHKVTYFGFEFSVRKHIETLNSKNFKINKENYFIDDLSCEINELVSQIRGLAKEGHKLFIIDSQMKIQAPIVGRTIEEVETIKFTTLAELAKRLQVIIVLIIQNSKNDSYAPTGSRKGAHEAHVMIRIEKIKSGELKHIRDYNERGKHRKVLILKNKQTGLQGIQFFRIDGYRLFEIDKNYSHLKESDFSGYDLSD